jgi:hypothetical protein
VAAKPADCASHREWRPSPMGAAVYDSCLPLQAATLLYRTLQAARERPFFFDSHLHAILLILWPDAVPEIKGWPAWNKRFQTLCEDKKCAVPPPQADALCPIDIGPCYVRCLPPSWPLFHSTARLCEETYSQPMPG